MEKTRQHSLLLKVGDLGAMSADEARALLDEVSDDGIESRAEAEAIFQINRKLDDVFPDWDERFCSLMKSYLVTAEEPVGWVDTRELNWLVDQIAPHASVAKRNEFDLLVSILPHVETTSIAFYKCILETLIAQAVRARRMTAELVRQLRAILLNAGENGHLWIAKWEAQSLLKLNERIGFARNDDSWIVLYTRAIANHLLVMSHPAPERVVPTPERGNWLGTEEVTDLAEAFTRGIQSDANGAWFDRFASSPASASSAHAHAKRIAKQPISAPVDKDNWLVQRLGWNNKTVTLADRALIEFLKEHMPGFAQGITLASRSC